MTDTRNTMIVAVALVAMLLYAAPVREQETWSNDELMAEINAAVAECRPVRLPAKVILTDTIELRRISGLTVQGNGRMFSYPANQPVYSATQIVWQGTSDKPMFRSAGIGLVFDSVSFVFEQPAFAAVHVVNAQGIAGGGKHVFENCSFIENPANRHRSYAIACGMAEKDGHCDALVIRSCLAVDCRSLLTTFNTASVGHSLSGNHTVRCDSVVHAEYGGKISVFGHASVDDRCLLRIVHAGNNVNRFILDGVSIDRQASDSFFVIDNAKSKRSFVRISGKFSGPERLRSDVICNDRPEFDLSGLEGVK